MGKGTPLGEYTPGEKFVRGPVSFVLASICMLAAGGLALDATGYIDISETLGINPTVIGLTAAAVAGVSTVVWIAANSIDTHD